MPAARTGSLGVATTTGDLYVVDANGNIERVPVGAANQVLVADPTAVGPSGAVIGVAWKNADFVSKASFEASAIDAIFKTVSLAPGGNPSIDTRGTHSVLKYDPSALRGLPWQKYMPTDYSGGDIRVTITWASDGTNAGNAVWQAAFERDNSGFDIDADGFAAVQTATTAAPGVAGQLVETTILFTNAQADGIVAGEPLRLFVGRDGAAGTDTLTDNALLVRVVVEEV